MRRILLIIFCCMMLFSFVGCKEKDDVNIVDSNHQHNDSNEQSEMKWDEISSNGIDEEKLIENIDEADLEEIATLLQELTNEIEEKERDDPEFAVSAGWFTYTLDSDKFKKVIDMGAKAAKPLYLIIYKSPNQGLFEYICAMALDEITNCVEDDWKTSKEFLNYFNKYILEQ